MMKERWPLILLFLSVFIAVPASLKPAQDDAPQVKIIIPGEKKTCTWNEQIRYSISVFDSNDGDSRYGEIPNNECSLTISYVTGNNEARIKQIMAEKDDPGLLLMKRSNCFGCHAHKAKLAGPSFQEIAKRYGNDERTVELVGDKIMKGSIGTWGDQQMPANEELTAKQSREIAVYILTIGDDPHRSIYAGLEGAFRVMDKPNENEYGTYVLRASYTSKSGKEGTHAIVLGISNHGANPHR
jgi:cytochrome c